MNWKTLPKFWQKLGPGLITGVSDNDPSGIITYSQAGAAFGFSMLWVALITYPLMFCIQEMCARIGIITGAGLGQVIKACYPKPFIWILLFTLSSAITFNIAANLAGMGAVVYLFLPSFPVWFYTCFFALLLIWGLIFFPYQTIASVLKWFCFSSLVYIAIPFLVEQDWLSVARAVIWPNIEWSQHFWSLLVAVLGTTLSPYLFFWQTSISIEDKNHKNNIPAKKELEVIKVDINFGMLWSNIVMFFIILTTGSVLFQNGLTDIKTISDAAKALEPLAGQFAYQLFAIGVVGTGLLAIPVLAGCSGYLFADVFKWEKGMDKKFKEAKGFYSIILISIFLGLCMNIFDLDPMQSLIYTAFIYGILAPFLILLILHICNQTKIMQNHTNPWWSNLLGICALFLTTGAALFLFIPFKTIVN